MKLWLQVLFAQGYLWRDRFPEQFDYRPLRRGVSWLMLIFGLSLVTWGIGLVVTGSPITGTLMVLTGSGFVVTNFESLGFYRLGGSAAFWISVGWGSVSAALVGMASLFAVFLYGAVFDSIWALIGLVWIVGFIACCCTASINAIECRYLFFASPRDNACMLEESGSQSIGQLWKETFWLLPRQILFGIQSRRPPPEGGTA